PSADEIRQVQPVDGGQRARCVRSVSCVPCVFDSYSHAWPLMTTKWHHLTCSAKNRETSLCSMATTSAFSARNVRFPMNEEVPRHWQGRRRAVPLFFNNPSLFFPPGERFFVAAVSHHKKQLKDEKLAEHVQAFCGQEGFHSREHVRYNRMLESQGYPAQRLEG